MVVSDRRDHINKNMQTKKGFTLIELLIVIGIIAILATAVLLVINPAQILAETRDTQRLNDLDVIRSAINLHLTTTVGVSFNGAWYCTFASAVGGLCDGATLRVARGVDGTGWVNINFGTAPPISILPLDPAGAQTEALHYSFRTEAATNYEITAQMESTKYSSGGAADKEGADGGDNTNCYEVGNKLTLVTATKC